MKIDDVESYFKDAKIFDIENNKQLINKNAPDSIYKTLETIINFLLQRGQLSKILDFNDIIEPKFINQLSRK